MKKLSLVIISFLTFNSLLSGQNYAFDTAIGFENTRMVAMQMGFYENEKITSYITQIGERLVDHLGPQPFNYRFYVVDSYEPNAFALPGGYIFFTRGILALANSEDELAGVMGHEIIHTANRHSIQQMRKSFIPVLLQIPGAIIGSVVNEDLGNIINKPIIAGSELFLAKYSRRHETEADDLGIELSALAGYNPASLADILNNLNREMEFLSGEEERKSYFSSHPFTPNRTKSINKKSSKLSWKKRDHVASDKAEFLSMVDDMYFKENPDQGVFQENIFIHPNLNLTITFPESWEKINTPIAVGVIDPKQKGLYYMTIAENNDMPVAVGEKFIKEVKKEHKISPSSVKTDTINSLPSFEAIYTEKSDDEDIMVNNMWFRLDSITFQAVGMSYLSKADTISMIHESIRKLSNQERNSLKTQKIKIVEAKAGERLVELVNRTENVLDIEFVAIINGIESEYELKEGQLIKIVVEEPYVPESGK